MKYKILIFMLMVECAAFSINKKPFKGEFYNEENQITLKIDLYEASIESSNYSFLGKLNGYMSGKIYDVWFVTSYKISDERKAYVTLSNDLGSYSQKIQLTINEKGELIYEAQGSNAIRKVSGHKWQKVPSKMIFVEK